MSINLKVPDIRELKPKITVFGVGGAGGNAVNNMIRSGLAGCEFVVANTDAQALASSQADRRIQMGVAVTEGLGAGSQPEIGRAAAEEAIDEIIDHLTGAHMVFVTAGMGGGTGTGAAPVIARAAREAGVLTVGVVTKPFQFEGARRMRVAEAGIADLEEHVDTLIVIPNQNLFRVANEKTTFADAFAMADQVLFSGVACITDLMVKEGLINLDFADVRSVMREMGKAMMGTGEASGQGRAQQAAEAAIANPLLDETSMLGAKGLLISITGGRDLTLFEVDEAATRIREEVDPDANVILGATFDEALEGVIRVSVVATGIEKENDAKQANIAKAQEITQRLRTAAATAGPSRASTEAAKPQAKEGGLSPARPQMVAALQNAQAAAASIRPAGVPPQVQPTRSAADPDVMIAPLNMTKGHLGGPDIDPERPRAPADAQPPGAEPFIPPPPESPNSRIPRVDEFPEMVQRQLSPRNHHEEERGPRSLLKRLAHVGLGRREEPRAPAKAEPPPMPRQLPNAGQGATGHGPTRINRPPQQPQPQANAGHRPIANQDAGRGNAAGMYQPRRGDLDAQGRAIPRDARIDENELEIPAFLRRQAN
jgi:cell division protein FtsZ